MNYLTHIYLAQQSESAMVGAVLGDFVKGELTGQYSLEIEIEIALHRRIDSYTDRHPVVRQARHLFEPPRQRFAGIILDIFYDHVLARHWHLYCNESLAGFTSRFYEAMHRHSAILPAPLDRIAPLMSAQDWLGSYYDYAGVEEAVCRVSTRLSRNGAVMREGLRDLKTNYQAISAGFSILFDDLAAYTASQREHLVQHCIQAGSQR